MGEIDKDGWSGKYFSVTGINMVGNADVNIYDYLKFYLAVHKRFDNEIGFPTACIQADQWIR